MEWPLMEWLLPVEIFLRLDPLVAVLVPVAIKEFVPTLGVGLAILALALLLGRFFCGYICPMGISLDVSRNIVPHKIYNNKSLPTWLPKTKYLILTAIAFSALLGVSHIFWGSPIALITRFYALLLHPILLLFAKFGLDSARPFIETLDMPTLSYLQIKPRVFYSVYFIASLFGLLFLLERMRPRFWCRYLCPAGAILGLLSAKPIWRRRVHTCIECGKCTKHCPTEAIGADPTTTKHTECITCHNCVDVCPVQGIYFLPHKEKDQKAQAHTKQNAENNSAPPHLPIPTRRAFLCAAGAGVGLASLGHINTASRLAQGAKGTVLQSACVRPPGARPEVDFLARCIRCGQCMKVCPTNGLQPTWITAGFEGVFSPVLMSRRGPCEPECAACGEVCPTGAIMDLPLKEKQQAKVGTAVVKPGLCLAWAEGRSCVVCQEVCAFGAISLQPNASTKAPVPIVNAKRCFGCGFCERHCPVHVPAIAVYPLNALRLNTTDYTKAAKSAGLDLIPVALRPKEHGLFDEIPEDQLPPGFSE